jgi:hypothetical protein
MDPVPILERIVKRPNPGDLLSLQAYVLSQEEKADSPLARERAGSVLALLEDFYSYLVSLECKLEAQAFAELASKMDMGAVGGVVLQNMLDAGERLLEHVLIGGLSEALTVLASRQYVKAHNRELEALYRQAAWRLRLHFWRFSAARRPELAPSERAALVDSLFAPLLDKEARGDVKPVMLGWLFQVLLLGSVSAILSEQRP